MKNSRFRYNSDISFVQERTGNPMLFEKIGVFDPIFGYLPDRYVAVVGEYITYVGPERPEGDFGRVYSGRGKLLMPASVNAHSHTAMTLMRGYGENMVLDDWLNKRIFPFEAHLNAEHVYHGSMLAFAEMIRFGTVSVSDMYFFADATARAVEESGVKCNMSIGVTDFEGRGFYELPAYANTMALIHDYHNAFGGRFKVDFCVHGEYTSNEKLVTQVAECAQKERLGIQIHLSETRKEHEECKQRHHGETPTEYFERTGILDSRVTAAHCTWAEEKDIEILKAHRATAVCCPVSNIKLAGGFTNVPYMLKTGLNVALGTDSVASNNNLNLFEEIKLYATLYKASSGDPTAVTPMQALFAATVGGARAQGRSDCGRVAEDYRADLAVLNTDVPYMHPVHDMVNNLVYSAQGSDVVLTMSDGQVLYENGEYKTIDIEKAQFEAQKSTDAILAQL